ncbi:Uncharacterized protein FWK35_00020291 [Aphis craccivora]|uniref:Uncharacterized protein n=1 Tax=Aphis craccivora TaxID=307492 RepID=A0A6G0YGV6_APHCR|nr:Uncharacterized protein FWK35_00020291 [Aphis craccivora]
MHFTANSHTQFNIMFKSGLRKNTNSKIMALKVSTFYHGTIRHLYWPQTTVRWNQDFIFVSSSLFFIIIIWVHISFIGNMDIFLFSGTIPIVYFDRYNIDTLADGCCVAFRERLSKLLSSTLIIDFTVVLCEINLVVLDKFELLALHCVINIRLSYKRISSPQQYNIFIVEFRHTSHTKIRVSFNYTNATHTLKTVPRERERGRKIYSQFQKLGKKNTVKDCDLKIKVNLIGCNRLGEKGGGDIDGQMPFYFSIAAECYIENKCVPFCYTVGVKWVTVMNDDDCIKFELNDIFSLYSSSLIIPLNLHFGVFRPLKHKSHFSLTTGNWKLYPRLTNHLRSESDPYGT